ncbi:AraC family transcriptional regulator [Loigolactobacillus rennini]|uniref:AraC family transcriptional regulator n=1 Tax=Loigolactobacillus rennini TaxID=238013 RepID=UPI00070B9534|nr:AraC family transcriptional regulator [Loigolactobacillus rennini]
MNKRFISIPTIESGLYVFGGHLHTVAGNWRFFEQKHQAFELMCVLKGRQTTDIKGLATYTYGPGAAMIISPGTLHTNKNASASEDMTYICFHFNIESLRLKSEIISTIANTVIPATDAIAKISLKTATKIVELSKSQSVDKLKINLKIQITLLNYLYQLTEELSQHQQNKRRHFSDREAKVSRDMATLIEEHVDNIENHSFSFSDICQTLNISTGYGHRIFKKVYGITPLHFIEEQKYRKAKLLLGYFEYSIEDVAFMTGAGNSSIFSKQFKKWSGITPSTYRKQLTKKRRVRSISQSGYFE